MMTQIYGGVVFLCFSFQIHTIGKMVGWVPLTLLNHTIFGTCTDEEQMICINDAFISQQYREK